MTSIPAPRVREVITPEGVPLRFVLAPAGDRAAAFLLDLILVVAIVVCLGVAVLFAGGGDLAIAAALLALFLVRTFYFTLFELSWQGQTPGKRRQGIRAIDARGGPLSAEAIIARNLTREVEVFLPSVALAGPGLVYPGAPFLVSVAALGWMLLFGFLPLFDPGRRRVGDLVAGTIVVRLPATRLLDDLVAGPASAPLPAAAAAIDAAPAFTTEQLDVYGEYELQVLEGLLRDAPPARPEALATVAEKIRAKIGWEGGAVDDRAFLRAFYAALRGRLERRLLLGKRRAHKHDRSG